MRLIDVDELLCNLGNEHIGGLEAIKEYKGTNTWEDGLHTAWRVIDDTPIINAIPIEWIEHQISDNKDLTTEEWMSYRRMINDWRKENESSISN